jgi:2-polyprenyl-6-methoxyphenol hydroxylase-like FAD-dependent oxidoreductase
MSIQQVGIIGAGLAGLTLALALDTHSIAVTVYESRPAPLDIGGAVMLSPNALKVLDALDLHDTVQAKGYAFDLLHYRDPQGQLLETYEFGSRQKYGYSGLRIYRSVLIGVLVDALQRRGIKVVYGAKFSHVVSDEPSGVTFALTDGRVVDTGLLVGADGIHSTVRKHLYPSLTTRFTGMAGITAAVPTSQLGLPEGYHVPVTITSAGGAFVIAPQGVDGSEVLIGKQMRVPMDLEPGWDREFVAEKESAVAFLQRDNDEFPEFVRNAVSRIDPAKVNKWPFFVVPKLDNWASESRRVVILGDAAHAIPPSAGQGINQAFEDVYMLALILGERERIKDVRAALSFWQEYRQARVDRVLELNAQIDLRRMPGSHGGLQRGEFDLEWLYKPDFKAHVEEWVKQQ